MIVGAGGAGGIVAKELATRGLRVEWVERGRQEKFAETGHDVRTVQKETGESVKIFAVQSRLQQRGGLCGRRRAILRGDGVVVYVAGSPS